MKYDAFISYRHAPLDMEMAKKVHSGLENYHVPSATQKKIGKKKINRVFRDQEELPIGSDLDDNISGALAESEYLIVICSPRTPGSYWVCKEIDTFIYLHDRDHILAVLVEGEPDESFPPQLLVDDNGKAVEPLAADVRGTTAKERNNKFKTEILRLAAPVLGCNYDDLKLRHRERIIKRNITIAASVAGVVAAAGAAFGIYNANVAKKMSLLAEEKTQLAEEKTLLADEKTQLAEEVLEQYSDKQANQSRYLAAESLSLYSEGNVKDAVLVAKAALPSAEEDRPYVPAAEYALGKALHAYSIGDTAEFAGQLEHNAHVKNMVLSGDATRLVSCDQSEAVYVWNIDDQKEITYISPQTDERGALKEIVQIGMSGDNVLVCRKDGICEYDIDGTLISELPLDDNITGCEFYPESSLVVAVTGSKVFIVSLTELTVMNVVENAYDLDYSDHIAYCGNLGIIAVDHYSVDGTENYIEIIDEKSLESRIVKVSDSYITDMAMSEDGKIAVLSYDMSDMLEFESSLDISLDFIDGENAEILWSVNETPVISHALNYDILLKIHSYGDASSETTEIVMTVDNTIYSYDIEGNMISSFGMSECIEAMTFSASADTGLVAEYDGSIDYVNFSLGSTTAPGYINADRNVVDMLTGNGKAILMSMSDSNITIMGFEEADDLAELATNGYSVSNIDVSPDGKYMVPSDYDGFYSVYDGDGNFIADYDAGYSGYSVFTGFNAEDFFVNINGSYLYEYDIEKGEKHQFPLTSQDMSWVIFEDAKMCGDGNHLLAWGNTAWTLINTENGKIIDGEVTEQSIRAITVTDDFSKVYVCTGTDDFYVYDTDSGERESLNLGVTLPSGLIENDGNITVSPDGEYFSVLCGDGNIRMFNSDDLAVIAVIPLNYKSHFYAGYTPDSQYYIYQADDRTIYFVSAQDGTVVSSIEADSQIYKIDFDTEKGIIAIKLYSELILADMYSFTEIADISGGQAYVAGTGKIYACYYKQIYSLGYKDYKKLLEIADEKYGDCSLTDEEKVKYFLD